MSTIEDKDELVFALSALPHAIIREAT
jgi:hypothetical protein